MSILPNIEDLLKEQGKTRKELCSYLGLLSSSFSAWSSGTNESYLKYIPKMAKFFGVPISRIYGEGGTPKHFALNKLVESLTPGELEAVESFIELYRKKPKDK